MLRWVDVSRWQVERANPLTPALAKAADYDIVNLAMTGGRGYVAGGWFEAYAKASAAVGLGRSTYHWLDGRTSGAAQAAVNISRLRNTFGAALEGFAHCVDVEETGEHGITPPKWQHVYDYVGTMQEAIGRPVAVYSADWWWRPKAWPGSTLTPFVMGMPNAGSRGAYPGDTSDDWVAGWGGWPEFAILQWGVRPLPGTGDCSLSVIRDPAVWAAMTGGPPVATLVPCLDALRSEFNRSFPQRDKGSDGWIGDTAHSSRASDHNPDARGIVHAIDVDEDLKAPGVTMPECVAEIIRRHRDGEDNRLTYVIYEKKIYSASQEWRARDYTGANPHDKHAHFSASSTRARETNRAPFGVEDLVKDSDRDDIVKRTTAAVVAALGERTAAVDAPTAKQVADAVIRADVDWSDGTYSLAGAVFDAKKNSKTANDQLTLLAEKVDAMQETLDQIVTAAAPDVPPAGPTES